MAFNSIPGNWIAVGKALKQSLFQYIKDNFDELNTRVATVVGNAVPNGSFELIDPSTGNPVNWTINLYPGGAFAVNETGGMHGRRAVYFTSPGGSGNGGGYATSDYSPCSPYMNVIARWMHYSDVGVHNLVQLLWYDGDKLQLSGGSASTLLYDSGTDPAMPSTPKSFVTVATPPAGAYFCKIRITGCDQDNTTAGSSFWDDVYVAPASMEVVASGTISGVAFQGPLTYLIRTGYTDLTTPWNSATPFTYSAMVQVSAGSKDAGHAAILWQAKAEVFLITGFGTGGVVGSDFGGNTWYRGDVGISVSLAPLNLLTDDLITSFNWVLTKSIG